MVPFASNRRKGKACREGTPASYGLELPLLLTYLLAKISQPYLPALVNPSI